MNKVKWLSYGKWREIEFANAKDAYRFWLALRPRILAKLYQNGKLVGEG